MKKYDAVLSDVAKADLLDIATYTQERYGERQADAYEQVLRNAIEAICTEPLRPGSRDRSTDLKQPGLRSYHTALPNDPSKTGVKSPRHLVLYSEPKEDRITIHRIIHEARDVEHQVTPDRETRQVYKAKENQTDHARER